VHSADYAKLYDDLETHILAGARSVGILGMTRVTLQIVASLRGSGLPIAIAVYSEAGEVARIADTVDVLPLSSLTETLHDVIVVASDEYKEDYLKAALPFVRGAPKAIIAGYKHFQFRDRVLEEELSQLLVPSFANGYPNTVTHLYQCLRNADRLKLNGVVAEFGMFKGGTTMLLSRLIERLGQSWPVIGFDTFDRFPDRRSVLDMYDHPGCIFTDLESVRQYFQNRRVEIVPGDVVRTCQRLASEQLVLTFIDTDNYTSAKAVLEIAAERTVIHGAIVFDHFTGVDRFRYTLGERMAAATLLEDRRYFNLHSTGVFYRQC